MRVIGAGTPGLKSYGRSDGGLDTGDIRLFAADPGPGWSRLDRDLTLWDVQRHPYFGTASVYSLAYANKLWIADAGTSRSSSSDLKTWTSQSGVSGTSIMIGATFADGQYCIVSQYGLWTGPTLSSMSDRGAIISGTKFIDQGLGHTWIGGTGNSSNQLAVLPMGSTNGWFFRNPGLYPNDLVGIAFAPGIIVVAGGYKVAYSTDLGATWTVVTVSALEASGYFIRTIAHHKGRWILGCEKNAVITTADFVTWEMSTGIPLVSEGSRILKIVSGGDYVAAVTEYTDDIYVSPTGRSWVSKKPAGNSERRSGSLIYADRRFVAFGNGIDRNPYGQAVYYGATATWHPDVPFDKTAYVKVA